MMLLHQKQEMLEVISLKSEFDCIKHMPSEKNGRSNNIGHGNDIHIGTI